MKKFLILIMTGSIFLFSNGFVFASEDYSYMPNPVNLYDLDHTKAYTWGIDLVDGTDINGKKINLSTEKIISASLFFDDIHNYRDEYNVLFVDLLAAGTASEGVREYDGYHPWPDVTYPLNANYFLNSDKDNMLFKFENLDTTPRDITVTLNPDNGTGFPSGATLTIPVGGIDKLDAYALASYASDKIFGLGFDPDCHFYNAGITLTLTTESRGNEVPEPATLILFGAGLLGLASRMRKKNQA